MIRNTSRSGFPCASSWAIPSVSPPPVHDHDISLHIGGDDPVADGTKRHLCAFFFFVQRSNRLPKNAKRDRTKKVKAANPNMHPTKASKSGLFHERKHRTLDLHGAHRPAGIPELASADKHRGRQFFRAFGNDRLVQVQDPPAFPGSRSPGRLFISSSSRSCS